MAGKANISAELINQFRTMRGQGYSFRKIAKKYHVAVSTVQYNTDGSYKGKLLLKKMMHNKIIMPAWPKPLWLTSFEERRR